MLRVEVELPSECDQGGGHQREEIALKADPELLRHAHLEGHLIIGEWSGDADYLSRFVLLLRVVTSLIIVVIQVRPQYQQSHLLSESY